MKQDTATGKNHGDNYCYYYLHQNGDLIHKTKRFDTLDFEESPFVIKWWIVDLENRLESVYKEYVGGTFNAHDAAGDAMATYELAVKMLNRESVSVGNSVQEWEAFSFDRSKMVDFAGKFIRNDEGVICFNVGKDKGKPVTENPSFLKWMTEKEFPNDTKNWARKLLNQ